MHLFLKIPAYAADKNVPKMCYAILSEIGVSGCNPHVR